MESTTVHAPEQFTSVVLSNRFSRRARVSLACCRCKTRKSKCDGVHPSCSGCLAASVECKYPQRSKQQSKSQYIRTLEDHIIELEKRLAGSQSAGAQNTTQQAYSPLAQSAAGSAVDTDHDGGGDYTDQEKVDFLTMLLRDISCDSGGMYVGASSNIFMGKAIAAVVGNRKGGEQHRANDWNAGNQSSPNQSLDTEAAALDVTPIKLVDVQEDVANRLYLGYLQHISTRWPILHTPHIAQLHCHKDELVDFRDKIILHLIYANGGRYLETTGERGTFTPERHYNAAAQFLEFIVGGRDIYAVQVLLLLGIYSLRAPKVPGTWNFVGLAMRTCIELGLHRRRRTNTPPDIESELACRIFWTAYVLDRQTSLSLGRPFALHDQDIDAELPMNINEESRDISMVQAMEQVSSTTMACFRHTIKIRQIESWINRTLYRLDGLSDQTTDDTIAWAEEQLTNWREGIPPPCHIPPELGPRPYDELDYYLHFYYNCQRQLYLPMVLSKNSKYVQRCAEACVGVCETFKNLHRNSVVGYSLWALQTVFLAGLTLIYTTQIRRTCLAPQRVSHALNACNIVLYVIVERWPMAKKYRDAFEELKESLDVLLADPDQQEQRRLPSASNSAVREILNDGVGLYDYEQMVLSMFTDDADTTTGGPIGPTDQAGEVSLMSDLDLIYDSVPSIPDRPSDLFLPGDGQMLPGFSEIT